MLGLGTKLTSSSGLGDLRRDYNFLKGFLHSDIDFDRDSNATQVGSDGYLKFAPNNLLTQSSDFSQWSSLDDSNIASSNSADPFGGTSAFNLESHDGLENLVPKSERIDQWAGTTDTDSNFTCTTTSASDPFGGNAAFTLSGSGSGQYPNADRREIAGISVTAHKVYYASVYVKVPSSNASSLFRIQLNDNAITTGSSPYPVRGRLEVQINSGAFETASSDSINTIKYESIAGGWYRVSFQFTPGVQSNNLSFRLIPDSTTPASSNTGKDMTFFGAQLNTYAVKPYFKTEGTATDEHENNARFEKTVSLVNGQCYVASIYAKRVDSELFQFSITGDGSYSPVYAPVSTIDVDVHSNGTMGLNSAAGVYTATDATFTDVGNGWVRCSFKFVSNVTTNSFTFRVRPDKATGYLSTLFYGPQLEATFETQPTDYNITDNNPYYGPRFDYDKDGNKKGLLIEEARTNLLVQSQDFTNSWARTSVNLLTLASNITDPSGGYGSYKLTEDTSNAFHFISLTPTIGASAHTLSCYMKKGERTTASLMLTQSGNFGAIFNLETGQVDSVTGTGNTAQIVDVGNSWYRCSITNDGSANIEDFVRIGVQNGAMASYTGDGVSGIYIFGAQLEAGSFPTSLIPTYGATADRAADIATVSGTAFSGFFKDTEGTIVAEVQALKNYTPNFNRIYNFSNNSFSDELELWMAGSTYKVYGKIVSSSSSQGDKKASDVLITSGEITKLGQIYKTDIHTVYQDGVKGEEDNSVNLSTTLNKLNIGARFNNSKPFTGWIRRLRYFIKQKSDTQVQKLTDTSFLLDKFKGAKAAHSLRSLRDGRDNSPVTRIRREYDSYEADYTAAQVSNGELENDFKSEKQTTLPLDVSVEAEELVQTPDFSSGTGWETGTGWTISGGVATHTGSVGNLGIAATLKPNKQYVITLDVLTLADQTCNVYDTGTGDTYGNFASVGSHSLTFTKIGTADLAFRTSSSNCVIDNASLKQVNPIGTGFSTRLINADYKGNPLMRIRRQDNTEAELYADDNDEISLSSSIKGSSQNLLPFSENFGEWSNARTSAGLAAGITDPFGGNNSYLVTQTTATGGSGSIFSNQSVTSGKYYTLSVYAKKKDKDFIVLYDTNFTRTYFNLANGTVGTVGSSQTNATITAIGSDGWYRISAVFKATSSGAQNVAFYLADSDNSTTVTVSDGVYIHAAQLEETQYESTGTELVTNGDFSTSDSSANGIVDWLTASGAGIPDDGTGTSLVNGKLRFDNSMATGTSSDFLQIFQRVDVVAGRKYSFSGDFDILGGTISGGGVNAILLEDASPFASRINFGPVTADGTVTGDHIATITETVRMRLDRKYVNGGTDNDVVADIDNISLVEYSPKVSDYSQTPVVVSTNHSTDATDLQSFAGKENLIAYTSTMMGTGWSNNDNVEIASTGHTDPFGGTTAILARATGTDPFTIKTDNNVIAGQKYVFSMYMKGVGTTIGKKAKLQFWFGPTLGTSTGPTTYNSNYTLTDEWQRFELEGTPTGSGTLTLRFDPVDSAVVVGEEVLVSSPQLNTNSAKDYIETVGNNPLTADINVVNWYSQSYGEDFVNATAGEQPRIVMGSELVTDSGGKASVYFDGSERINNDTLSGQKRLDSYFIHDTSDTLFAYPVSRDNSTRYGPFAADGSGSPTTSSNYGTPSFYFNGSLPTIAGRNDYHDNATGYKLITHQGASTSAWSQFSIGMGVSADWAFTGKISEMIFFPNMDSSPKRFNIEQNILKYFGIYHHESDFSADTNGYEIVGFPSGTDMTIDTFTGNNDGIAGRTDVLRVTVDSSSGGRFHLKRGNLGTDTVTNYEVTFDYLTGGSGFNNRFWLLGAAFTNTHGTKSVENAKIIADTTWRSVTLKGNLPNSGELYIKPTTNTSLIVGDATNDNYGITGASVAGQTIYFKNIKVRSKDSDGFVTTLYDQTGNNCHAVQDTAANQCQIIRTGSLIKSGNHPAWDFIRGNPQRSLTIHGLTGITDLDAFFVHDATDTKFIYPSSGASNKYGFPAHDDSGTTALSSGYGGPVLEVNGSEPTATDHDEIYEAIKGRKLVYHRSASTTAWAEVNIGNTFGTNDLWNLEAVKFSEMIWYDSDQHGNQSGIESNITNYYF